MTDLRNLIVNISAMSYFAASAEIIHVTGKIVEKGTVSSLLQ